MDHDDHEHGHDAPICAACGVTALPSENVPDAFVCENPDCDTEEM